MAKKTVKKDKKTDYFVHSTAQVEDEVEIGGGTKIWHFAQLRSGSKIGQNCVISNSVFVDSDSEIGNNVKIQNHAIVYHKAIIHDGVFIGPNVCFTNDKVPRAINADGSPKSASDWVSSTIEIGEGASIGGHSVILPGVKIGRFVLAGSGSVITKDVPDYALVFGNPARIKAFVCKCGKKLQIFERKGDWVVGKCGCGIDVLIDPAAYEQLEKPTPKKRIWLR